LFIFFFLGLMAGTIIPLCLTICLEIKTIPEDLTGTASGLVLTFGFLGSLTSTLLFGTFISLSGIFLFCSLYLICLGIGSLLLSFKQQK
jgi:cyanate permease